jgi:4-hydroxythreonine-4-phosphate dehydrogenase
MMVLPRIGITAGDPAGIGPEIARKAMADSRVLDVCEPLYYGSQQTFTPGV